ncbi:MAG: hypothetical protein JO232_16040 [Verrucomicrobia bacterium]|nr:hypothetical protein [Verrucomicrobiota bacterium]
MSKQSGDDLTIIGGGLELSAHLSVEACKAIRAARRVYYHGASCHDTVIRWLAILARDSMLIDIDKEHYKLGQYRPDMYKAMAMIVAKEARDGGGVVLIEQGSSVVTDLVTPYALLLADQFDLKVRVIPGISSLEQMFVLFGLDPSSGLQVILAQELVVRQIRLNPQLDTIIMQPGYYDTFWWAGWPKSRKNRFGELSRQLLESYPNDQKMVLARLPMHPQDQTHEFWFRLDDLGLLHPIITPLHTLFIPAAGETEKNREFQQRMNSWKLSVGFLETDPDGSPVQNKPVTSIEDLQQIESRLPRELLERAKCLQKEWQIERVARRTARVAL